MTQLDEWVVGEDGSLTIGEEIVSVTYHGGLNVVLISSKANNLKVLDIPSGVILRDCKLLGLSDGHDEIWCQYFGALDRVVYCDGRAVGIRKDLSGVLLLDTALQTPVNKNEDPVNLELLLPEANSLFQALMSAELPGVDYVDDVLKELEKEIEAVRQEAKGNHKQSKWAVVCLKLPHCALKTVCRSLVEELKRQNDRKPGLATAASVFDRLQCLFPKSEPDIQGANAVVDRTLMYSELSRRETFSKWPHMNYKWALPEQMAQAGFYHQPAGTGDDRALCFTCNVCLVCWEPTDEPWSEHERHSPQCPFVKGEFTQNVPCAASYGAEPAHLHGNGTDTVRIECVSTTSSSDYIASSSIHGNIVVWDTSRQFRKHIEFNVDPWESIIAAKTGTGASVHGLEPSPTPVPPPEAAQTDSPRSDNQSATPEVCSPDQPDSSHVSSPQYEAAASSVMPSTTSAVEVADSKPSTSKSSPPHLNQPDQVDKSSKSEVIEVGGAWKVTLKESSAVATSVEGDIVEIPLEHEQPVQEQSIPQVTQRRCRPSLDVLVSSLCVLGAPSDSSSTSDAASESTRLRPCLVSGLAIRRNTGGDTETLFNTDNEDNSEVHALNQVNQAITEDSQSQIISQNLEETRSPNPFVSYLLVHDISSLETTSNNEESSKSVDSRSKASGGTKQWGSAGDTWKPMPMMPAPAQPNLVQQTIKHSVQSVGGMYQSMSYDDSDDEDDQLQILEVIAPHGTKNVSQHSFKFGSVPQLLSLHQNKKVDQSAAKVNPSRPSGTAKASVTIAKEGQVLQCIELPNQVGNDHYVRSITPTLDGRYVIVAIAPRCLNRRLELLANNHGDVIEHVTGQKAGDMESKAAGYQYTNGGYLLLYKVTASDGSVMLSTQPAVISKPLPSVSDAVISLYLLPADVTQSADEEESFLMTSSSKQNGETPEGYIAITTKGGQVKILDICDFRVLATITAPNEETFISATYCAGIDRLCCSTKDGKLHFYILKPNEAIKDVEQPAALDSSPSKSEDVVDSANVPESYHSSETLLVSQPLTVETLSSLHELTLYENLVPRYTATVPQCWHEIQQEQQQRRHPQHLHRHGETNKHTRSWRLQQDSTSWDEHVFELVLPRTTAVGHVDLKFSLHPMCTSPPHVQVTLYKQKISSFSNKVLQDRSQAQVDSKIDFNLRCGQEQQSNDVKKPACEQIEQDSAEILCGPVDLASHVDMSGRCGIISLASPQLLKLKTKTLLLHIKALNVPADAREEKKEEPVKQKKSEEKSSKETKLKENLTTLQSIHSVSQSDPGKMSEAAIKQKLESVRGCDWLNELSITFRKNKLTSLCNPRAQRVAMLENGTFHERLLIIACGHEAGSSGVSGCEEHKQKLALDTLAWILAVQVCDITKDSHGSVSVLETIQANLKGLVQAAYIEGGRSIAHRCTKLIAQCLDYTKGLQDVTVHNRLTIALHSALLECVHYIPAAKSAGALRWFFVLLNRVKLVDSGATGQVCTSLLSSVAKHFSERKYTLHSLLKTRYGLYGHPFDPELFDVDPPAHTKFPSNGSVSYAAITGTGAPSVGTTANQSWNAEDFDSKELLSLSAGDKAASSAALSSKLHADLVSRHVCGLLEVEPLHYNISATSDGTKVEKVDTVFGVSGIAGTMPGLVGGTMNFGENASSTAGAALTGLSTAEKLHKLQQKHQQLIKLQQQKQNLEQKLAETSKNTSTSSTYSAYNSELFPPTPKNTPFFMTPPLTPPNEAFVNPLETHIKSDSKGSSGKDTPQAKSSIMVPNMGNLFQAPPAQALVVERMSSGARRYVVLDFCKPIMLTDVIIPACLDLASLSIDVWVSSEESDGQRLVLTTDIGLKSLVLNDLTPPVCCRYLKLTTIGRYGSNATKSKIPIGSFYGHTFILPWEVPKQKHSNLTRPLLPHPGASSLEGSQTIPVVDQSQILSQIGVYISVQEDIQCRYSLACNRLESLLTAVQSPQAGATHTQYYLKKVKKSDEDNKIYQAYHECMNLQLQLNIAQRAIERLQKALGIYSPLAEEEISRDSSSKMLQKASTDRLRVLCELLLDCVMSITYPAVQHPPLSLYSTVTPALCDDLFRNLCVHGSKKMQMYTGLFLVRVCGCQAWWGRFLGNMLQQYFAADQPFVFPQDRLFLLLVSLGQRSLSGSKSCEILESLLMMLANILSPLIACQAPRRASNAPGSLDLTLIGWLLLFLSKCLDHVTATPQFESSLHRSGIGACAKDLPTIQNRWDFLHGESAMQSTKSSGKSSPSKMFRRKLQKRLMHTKQQLLDFQKTKAAMDSQEKTMLEKAKVLLKNADSCMQQLESQEVLKSQLKMSKDSLLKQYSAKHFKDVMNLRKTDGEMVRKLGNSDASASAPPSGEKENDAVGDSMLLMARERCIPVIRGLVALLLSMDFTCNVDLFIIASKVVARISQLTRPAISLGEVLSQEELEQLVLLMCNSEYNNGNVAWGGAWAGHAITCLLQDILEGERLSPQCEGGLTGLTDDEALASGALTETDDSLQNSTTLPTVEEDTSASSATPGAAAESKGAESMVSEGDNNNTMNSSYNEDKENWLDMIFCEGEDLFPFKAKTPVLSHLSQLLPSLLEVSTAAQLVHIKDELFAPGCVDGLDEDLLPPLPGSLSSLPKPVSNAFSPSVPVSNPFMPLTGPSTGGIAGKSSSGTKNLGAQASQEWWQHMMSGSGKKLGAGSRLTDYLATKAGISSTAGQGVSTAMDVRLEYGLEMPAEMKLRLMMTMEALRVHNALTAPVPQPSPAAEGIALSSCQPTDDEQISEATLLSSIRQNQVVPSSEMLSCCFNNLFMQLPMQRINLDALLQVWLTLNEETAQEENGVLVFDPGRTPTIPLSPVAVTSLLTALGWAPNIPVRTWVLAFQVLCLVLNQKPGEGASQSPRDGPSNVDQCMATLIVSNSNFTDVLVKFLSGVSVHGPVMSSSHQFQIGPTATKCFYLFLSRISLRSPNETYSNFKELLLKLLHILSSESTRGALHCHIGPQDAQCKLVEFMTELSYHFSDVTNALNVIEAVTKLVYQHIISQDRVVCKSSSESSVSARSCFGGLIGNALRGSDDKSLSGDCSRDTLMCSLLKLVNSLVQLPVPGQQGSSRRRAQSNVENTPSEQIVDSPLTDTSKISQAFGGEGSGIVTSTPTVGLSDEEKRQGTDDHRTDSAAANTPALTPKPKPCTHFSDMLHPEREERNDTTLGDIVLSNYQTVMHLIQALSSCSSNTMAMILGSSMKGSIQDTFACIDPISVGDGIFHILCSLNRKATDLKLILKPLHDYLSCSLMGSMSGRMCRLSEPLLWFMLRVLDCPQAIRTFMDMGGIEVLCESLVKSSKQVINTAPSLVSTMMHSLGSSSKISKKIDTDSPDQLINFAPLGTVSSSIPKAGPAEILIGATPPHRRARSAAFSYHFYPDEMWMDLTITLPCSVVLKEVHVQPHVSSLATCPAAVSLEVSRDGMASVPICAPQSTSGFTTIKLQLLKPEVVSAVTIRLHRPLDSSSVGLSQIRLMGNTAFGETGAIKSSNFFAPVEDYVSRTSVGWLRLLHHCLSECGQLAGEVAAAAAPTPHLLATCTALLLSPSAVVYDHNIEQVLLKIGLHSEEMGLCLIDYLLKGHSSRLNHDVVRSVAMHGHRGGMANESTVDILYHLGVTQDGSTKARVQALCQWLEDSAIVALQRASPRYPPPRGAVAGDGPRPSEGHVQCVAAVLWYSHTAAVTYNLRALVSQDLLRVMYEWSCMCEASVKEAVDAVICALCCIQPQYYYLLLQWTGVLQSSLTTLLTDDSKDERQHLGPLTDDTKADNEAQRYGQPMTDDQAAHVPRPTPCGLADLSHMTLDQSHLATLAMASQSPETLNRLLETGFLSVLCQALFEFCTQEMSKYVESLIGRESMTDASKSASSSPRSRTQSETSQPMTDNEACLSAEQASDVLRFLSDISQEARVKDWLGAHDHSAFWAVLLNLLCTTPAQVAAVGSLSQNVRILLGSQRARLETETISFFKQAIACHQDNQLRFANVLCDVMKTSGLLGQSSALSGFMRRLFLQVLLEDEKVLIGVQSHAQMYKGSCFSNASRHPRCGAGHKYRAVLVSLNSTCAEVLAKVSDTATIAESEKTTANSDTKDITDIGLQMVNNISQAAGLSAQEKRNKTPASSADSLPPRPPSRRGHRPSPVSSNVVAPALYLFHDAMPYQPLPGELTLAQLLVILQARGHNTAHTFLQLKMKLRSKFIEDTTEAEERATNDLIPDKVLLDTTSFPSALQVFAGVGGLSLLAEHLPVLYPEVSKASCLGDEAAARASAHHAGTSSAVLGHSDWVTVESADDLYDDIYEPLPPPSQGREAKQMASLLLPSIPPHSLVSFGVFLRLPGYAEVLLKERGKAQCLLRLVLGVTDDGEGGHILSNSVAGSLPTLPFTVLRSLCDSTPLSTDDGVLLRRMTLEIGVVHLLLACLSVLSHHAPRQPIPGFHQEVILAAMQSVTSAAGPAHKAEPKAPLADEKGQQYWAKGTGFGTGSTMSSWDSEQTMLRKRSEEEHVTCLIQVLASFINPGGQVPETFTSETYMEEEEQEEAECSLPAGFAELLTNSCLVPAICAYLRNDSVLDMSRHIALYRALLELLRGVSVCPPLVHLLLPLDKDDESSVCVVELLDKMKTCVDTYASRLKSNKGKNGNNGNGKTKQDVEDSEGLALLIPDIQGTAKIVNLASQRLKRKTMEQAGEGDESSAAGAAKDDHSAEDKYIALMKKLQFDTYEMVIEDDDGGVKFTLAHHYESNVKSAGDVSNASRARRLAQEAVTLSTSLPLSYNSTVFVRCDEERLDVMKVLITGPSDTPYGNGCFEFDVYFPQDYPNSPPLVNLETTGNRTVRFNPNLYNDGKVCLSVLNTWHGRPEEKWNSQTSSFLQVLVSIQSLILVSEPYFNEPGYERSRGTPSGTASSREYDANIRQATVKWAMLEMLRNPPACFKQVIQSHMWAKRHEICAQIELWIQEMEDFSTDKRTGRTIAHSLVALKRHYSQLKEEFAKMKAPAELEDDDDSANENSPNGVASTSGHANANGLCSTSLSNSSSETGTLSDSNTSTSTDSALSQELNPTVAKYSAGSVGDNAKHLEVNHVDTVADHVPMSNGDVSEDVASMFLGPEEDNPTGLNLQSTGDIMFL